MTPRILTGNIKPAILLVESESTECLEFIREIFLFQIKLQTLLAQLVSQTRRNMAPLVPDKRAALLSEIQSLVEEATPEASARLFNAAQVALLFGVSERTVRVWANKNWIPAIRTPSGHWKFPAMQ